MTDKADIAALREECAQWVKDAFGDTIDTSMALNGDGNDHMAWDMAVIWRAWFHLSSQLEAERQRADVSTSCLLIDAQQIEIQRLRAVSNMPPLKVVIITLVLIVLCRFLTGETGTFW